MPCESWSQIDYSYITTYGQLCFSIKKYYKTWCEWVAFIMARLYWQFRSLMARLSDNFSDSNRHNPLLSPLFPQHIYSIKPLDMWFNQDVEYFIVNFIIFCKIDTSDICWKPLLEIFIAFDWCLWEIYLQYYYYGTRIEYKQ